MTFQREDRYVVLKLSHLTANQRERLYGFLGDWRINPVKSAVVEADWPEYEVVWGMIQRRVEAEDAERIRQAMVQENNHIAYQADMAYEAMREAASLTDEKLVDPTIQTMIADMNGEIEG